MKKLLSCMAIVLAVALTMTSCTKDEETGSEANRLKFPNKIFYGESSLTYTWEGV